MQTPDLFGFQVEPQKDISQTGDPTLSQFLTPEWVGEELFPHVEQLARRANQGKTPIICEPSCGKGAMLKAIPPAIPAYGVEIDPLLAPIARRRTGREIINDDFLTCSLPEKPHALFGNPPFVADLFDQFLLRAEDILPDRGICGFILPVYFFQTSSRVSRYNRRWSISYNLLPRDLFPGLKLPILFALFQKEKITSLQGFLLYQENQELKELPTASRETLRESEDTRSPWEILVSQALESLGGHAELHQLYERIIPNSPWENKFPKEKIRQTLQRGSKRGTFSPLGNGVWKIQTP